MTERPSPYRIAEFRDENDVPWFACQCWYPGLLNGSYGTLKMGGRGSYNDTINVAAFLSYDDAHEYLQKVIAVKKLRRQARLTVWFDEKGNKVDHR